MGGGFNSLVPHQNNGTRTLIKSLEHRTAKIYNFVKVLPITRCSRRWNIPTWWITWPYIACHKTVSYWWRHCSITILSCLVPRHEHNRTCITTMDHIRNSVSIVLSYSLYHPDMAPSDFNLFRLPNDGPDRKHFLTATPLSMLRESSSFNLAENFFTSADSFPSLVKMQSQWRQLDEEIGFWSCSFQRYYSVSPCLL